MERRTLEKDSSEQEESKKGKYVNTTFENDNPEQEESKRMAILERKLWTRTILNEKNLKTYHSGKEALKNDNSEQETSET